MINPGHKDSDWEAREPFALWMILDRCKDKSDLDKTDFITVSEKEILRPTDQTCFL